jgi:hypothetical protein
VEWVEEDMVRPPHGPFDGAYCFGNSFAYLDHDLTLEFLRRMADCVRPGGRFLLETGTAAECLLPSFQASSEYTIGAIKMGVERRYRFADSRILSTYSFSKDGVLEQHDLEQSVYSSGEICRMLEAAGFGIVGLYQGTDGTEAAMGARRLIAVAERNNP